MKNSLPVLEKSKLPKHLAIIMDGNGRWARDRGLPRLEGHRKGADVVRDITTFCREIEIPYLTLFSFSVQNWQRPADEVSGLMRLLEEYCLNERDTLLKNDIRLMTIGSLDKIPNSTREALLALIEETADNRSMTFNLAIDYGGREEIVSAVKRLAQDIKRKRIDPDQIDETAIETRLHTALIPDPDLLIRTSGENRLSNFLLWQLAYAELYFTSVRWPDFSRGDLAIALTDFAKRERRFGATSEQLSTMQVKVEDFVLGELPNAEQLMVGKGSGPC